MRPVVHLAVDADGAGAGLGGEGGDDGLGLFDLAGAGVNTALITGTCAGWMASRPAKPSRRASSVSLRRASRLRKSTWMVSIGRHFRRGGAEQADRAREPIGLGQHAVGIAVGYRADFGGRSSGPQVMPISRALDIAISAGGEDAGRGLHRLRQDFDVAFGNSGDRLARGELGVEMRHGRAAFRLGKHDGVGLARHDCRRDRRRSCRCRGR